MVNRNERKVGTRQRYNKYLKTTVGLKNNSKIIEILAVLSFFTHVESPEPLFYRQYFYFLKHLN